MEELAGQDKQDNSLSRLRREMEISPYHQLLGLEAVSSRDRLGNLMSPDATRVQAGSG